jgi:glycine/D-amino acid oxidase-like deaminating enzyme
MHNNFHYVIIGAGSAGLQLASMLLKAPKNLVGSILLLEKEKI